MIRLIAIYMNNFILYKDYVISLYNNQVSYIADSPETLLYYETDQERERVMDKLFKELNGACKVPYVVSHCEKGKNNMCCVQNIQPVKAGGRGKGKQSGGTGPGSEPEITQEITLFLQFNEKKGIVSVSLSPSSVEVTTHISDLPPDIIRNIESFFQNEIKLYLSLYANNLNPIYIKNAIESFIGIQNMNQVISDNMIAFKDTSNKNELDEHFKNLKLSGSIESKMKYYKKIFIHIHNNKDKLETSQTNTAELIKYSAIYNVIANLIDNAIDKCIEETEQRNRRWTSNTDARYEIFKATLELHNENNQKINLFSALSGNRGDFEFFQVVFPESHPISSFIYKKADKQFYLKTNDERIEKSIYELKIALQDIIYTKALANISTLDVFKGLKVVISNKYPERLHRKVFEGIVEDTNKSLEELEAVLNVSQKGGSSKKVRLNEYIMVNGRKKRLYKGERGGLYTMEKSGVFKRVPRDSY